MRTHTASVVATAGAHRSTSSCAADSVAVREYRCSTSVRNTAKLCTHRRVVSASLTPWHCWHGPTPPVLGIGCALQVVHGCVADECENVAADAIEASYHAAAAAAAHASMLDTRGLPTPHDQSETPPTNAPVVHEHVLPDCKRVAVGLRNKRAEAGCPNMGKHQRRPDLVGQAEQVVIVPCRRDAGEHAGSDVLFGMALGTSRGRGRRTAARCFPVL